ncbi:MAG: PAS domain-containing protein [Deltaproteobacteria bacterium]|nr:PAS domain-containing protein [Deltaproteobacteria bacterium]
MSLFLAEYYLWNLLITGAYTGAFLLYLSNFSGEDPRTNAFRRLLLSILAWAVFDFAASHLAQSQPPETARLAFVWLSFLFLAFPPAAGEVMLHLMGPVSWRQRLMLYGPYVLLYLVAILFPGLVSGATFGIASPVPGPLNWNFFFKVYTCLFTGVLLFRLLQTALGQSDPRLKGEDLVLFAGGSATLLGIIASQLLRDWRGPDFPWLANLATLFISLAALWGIRRYGRVFTRHTLYEATVQVIPGGLAQLRAGRILWANQGLAQLLGLRLAGELTGLDLAALLDRDFYPADEARTVAAALSRGELPQDEIRLHRVGGGWLPCLVHSAPLDPGDHAQGAVALFQDLTAQKEAMAERLWREKLSGAMETSGAVCHELNQPLQALQNRIELMGLRPTTPDLLAADLAKMAEICQDMTVITRRLQNLTTYQTKDYLGITKILDLARSSQEEAAETADQRTGKLNSKIA